jgi:N-acetylglucosamine-6-phosphate deacetylase
MLYIHNATVYTPDQIIEHGAILVDGRRIAAVALAADLPLPPGAETLDASGGIVAPGLIDLQINGAFGDDFTVAPETIWRVASGLPRWGVTSFLPTIITSPLAQVGKAQEVLSGGPPEGWRGSIPLGLHCEGPFLNPQKKGAHNPKHLRLPSLEAVAAWSPNEHVRLVTLAPELPGALEVIEALAARGVLVSSGHSMATYAEAQKAFAAGARYGTHLFNAMPMLEHREPGLPGALLTTPQQTAGIIPDGIHTHPAIVALAWQMKGPQRLNVVSDAMAALGKPPGRYMLGDQEVTVTERDARLPSGTLAGSVLSMDEALRRLIEYTGCSLAEALETMTSTPADLLGIGHERGRIIRGAFADLVVLTPDLHVAATLVEGTLVEEALAEGQAVPIAPDVAL